MTIAPYLFFEGRCEEAIEFYRKTIGAEVVMLMRFKDSPEPPDPKNCPPEVAARIQPEKIMHATLRIGQSLVMASDGQCGGRSNFQGFSLSLEAGSASEAERLFAALGAGGHVVMPLAKTFFAERFGMVADQFGLGWMVIVQPI